MNPIDELLEQLRADNTPPRDPNEDEEDEDEDDEEEDKEPPVMREPDQD
jgi:hypothetical protein